MGRVQFGVVSFVQEPQQFVEHGEVLKALEEVRYSSLARLCKTAAQPTRNEDPGQPGQGHAFLHAVFHQDLAAGLVQGREGLGKQV